MKITVARRLLAGTGFAVLAGGAVANCDSIVNVDYANAVSFNDAVEAAKIIASSPECFGGGATTSLVQINGTVFRQALAISSVLAARQGADGPAAKLAATGRGAAAGGRNGAFNVWANVGTSDSSQRYSAVSTYSNGEARNDMEIRNAVLGADFAVTPEIVVGLSYGDDRGSGSGGNSDPGFALNAIHSNGYVLGPYLGWQLNREFAVDASLGFGKGELRVHSTNAVDVDRWFAAANLNYVRWLGKLQLTGRASLMRGVEEYGDIRVNGVAQNRTAARNTIDQLRLGGQAAWWIGNIAPYVGLAYSNDIDRKTTQFGAPANPIGKDAWVWTFGANFYAPAAGITGGVSYSREEGRTHQKSDTVAATLNLRF